MANGFTLVIADDNLYKPKIDLCLTLGSKSIKLTCFKSLKKGLKNLRVKTVSLISEYCF